MRIVLKKFVRKYGRVHLSIAMIGNMTFFIGSILFFKIFKHYKKCSVYHRIIFNVNWFSLYLNN